MATNNKISTNNICFDGIVGIRDCSSAYQYFLDDYGFSLLKAVKTTDSAYGNAKNLVNTLIAQSIDDVINDIHFKSFQSNKILNDSVYGKIDRENEFTGSKTITFTLDSCLTLGSFYLSAVSVFVKTGGTLTVTLTNNATDEILYDDTASAGTLTIPYNAFVSDEWSVKIETDTAVLYNSIISNTCSYDCNYYTVDNTDNVGGLKIEFQVRCNKVKHLCRYSHLLAKAIIFKSLGKLYFQHYNTDSFNNYINSTDKDKLLSLMVYYDSTYINLINTERNPNEKNGQYQLELERLSKLIPEPMCTPCLECDTTGWVEKITLP